MCVCPCNLLSKAEEKAEEPEKESKEGRKVSRGEILSEGPLISPEQQISRSREHRERLTLPAILLCPSHHESCMTGTSSRPRKRWSRQALTWFHPSEGRPATSLGQSIKRAFGDVDEKPDSQKEDSKDSGDDDGQANSGEESGGEQPKPPPPKKKQWFDRDGQIAKAVRKDIVATCQRQCRSVCVCVCMCLSLCVCVPVSVCLCVRFE